MFLISLYCNETNKLSGLYCSRQNVEKSSLENLKLITKTFPSVHQKILSASKSQRWQSFPTHVHKVSEDLLGGSAKLFYLQYFKWSMKKKKSLARGFLTIWGIIYTLSFKYEPGKLTWGWVFLTVYHVLILAFLKSALFASLAPSAISEVVINTT